MSNRVPISFGERLSEGEPFTRISLSYFSIDGAEFNGGAAAAAAEA